MSSATLARSANGTVVVPSSPEALRDVSEVTAQLLVERASYLLSDVIFNYSPESFGLDIATHQWVSLKQKNLHGNIPDVYNVETRAGAGSSILGYLSQSANSRISVLASTGVLREFLPVIKTNLGAFQKSRIVFNVAAVDYNAETGALESNLALVFGLAKEFGFPTLVSNIGDLDDVDRNSATAFALSQLGPVIHVYDGLRGTQQSRTIAKSVDFTPIAKIAKPDSISDAFSLVGKALGTTLSPFEYSGPENAQALVVGSGIASLSAAVATSKHFGALNIRLKFPYSAEELIAAIPATVTSVVVLGQVTASQSVSDLYRDIATASHLHYGIGYGPKIHEFQYQSTEEPTSSWIASKLEIPPPPLPATRIPQAIVWDSDKSQTSRGISPLARAANYSHIKESIYTIYDNNLRGGAAEYQIRLGVSSSEPVDETPTAFINSLDLVHEVDFAKRVAHGGTVYILAKSAEEVEKALKNRTKKELLNKNIKIQIVNFDNLDETNTQGRTFLFAFQALFWLAIDPSLSKDQITSRIVHSNSQDLELIGATIDTIVDAIKEKSLSALDIKEWEKLELSEEELKAPQTASYLVPSSFVPGETINLEEEGQVEALSTSEVARRLVFAEAYGQTQELRPDLPTTNYIAKVKINTRVTPGEYERHIFHLELDISGTGLRYAIGEALGVHAPNNAKDVEAFLEWYGINANDIIGVPNRDEVSVLEFKTAFQAFRDNLDLFGKVPKRFYESLAVYATDEKQKKQLEKLASPEGAAELKRRAEVDFDNYADILKEFSSAHPPASALAELIAPLKRREYSIASSQKAHPNAVHLLIVVVDWKNKDGETRYGQTSKFLADLKAGAEVTVSVKPSVMKLPSDPKTPVIMAGLGTGLAPFKAFLEEKQWQREQGHEIGDIYLFLGARHQREEYLYGELFEAFKHSGVLTHIGAAFSRDQPEKIYIQHRIKQAREQLKDAFVSKGGNFYLCGPTWPVPDVSAALYDIVAGDKPKEDAPEEGKLIEELKDAERYILEVY